VLKNIRIIKPLKWFKTFWIELYLSIEFKLSEFSVTDTSEMLDGTTNTLGKSLILDFDKSVNVSSSDGCSKDVFNADGLSATSSSLEQEH